MPELPVLVISGLPGVEADAEELGYRFLRKPFALDDLILLVGSLTAHQARVEGLLPMAEPDLSQSGAARP
jgi:hypothetical protein